jgi:hypothetical protein
LVVRQVEIAYFGIVKYNSKFNEEVGVEEKREDLGRVLNQLQWRKEYYKQRKALSTRGCMGSVRDGFKGN